MSENETYINESDTQPCQDTSDPGTSDPRHFGTSAEVSIRHFGTSAELSRHFGTSPQMSWGHFGTRKILEHCATLDGKVDEYLS